MEWSDFIVRDFSFVEFAPGSRVVDIGCGDGDQLEDLQRAGLDPVGIERSQPLVDEVTARGLPVLHGVAERLPIRSHSADGVICKVVVPYTDERKAISEWARVLRPGGRVLAAYHGAGYYLRYLTSGPDWRSGVRRPLTHQRGGTRSRIAACRDSSATRFTSRPNGWPTTTTSSVSCSSAKRRRRRTAASRCSFTTSFVGATSSTHARHGAALAVPNAGRADEGAELHQGLIMRPRVSACSGEELCGKCPGRPLTA